MKNKVMFIAAVGLAGTGKSTFVEKLTKHTGWSVIYFGGLVLAEVKAQGLDVTPENERTMRESIRATHGPAAMAILALKEFDLSVPRSQPIIIDGLYSYAELKYLRKKLGDHLLSVAIHSSFEKRVERLSCRPSRPLNREQIIERDRAEIEKIEKAQPIALADKHFVNDAGLEELQNFVAKVAHSIK